MGGLPGAYAIVNPKQEGEEHCLRELCAGGLTYKLVGALFSSAQRAFEPEQFLELAMLATIFDRVPMTEINKKIVEQGILVLPRTERKGLRVLMDASGLELFDEQAICQKIISPLSAANCKNHKNKAFLLLTECVSGRAKKAAEELLERSRKKKEGVREIIQEIEDRGDLSASIVFEGDRDWTLALAGTVSSRICQEYRRPVFIYHRGEKHSQGSVRTPKEIDAIELMASCSGLLLNYGGHPRAAGFGLDNENIEAFKSCLIENLKKIESQILNVI